MRVKTLLEGWEMIGEHWDSDGRMREVVQGCSVQTGKHGAGLGVLGAVTPACCWILRPA